MNVGEWLLHQGKMVSMLLFTILFSAMFANAAFDIDRKKVIFRSLGMCKNEKTDSLPLQFYDVQVKHGKNKDTTISLKVKITKEIKSLTIKFNFCKCDSAGNPDSCEYVLWDYVNPDICEFIGKKDEVWTDFIDRFDKKPLCPMQPDIYSMNNLTVSSKFLKYLPISDAVWKLKMEATDKEELPVSCVETEMQITTFLRRKNKH